MKSCHKNLTHDGKNNNEQRQRTTCTSKKQILIIHNNLPTKLIKPIKKEAKMWSSKKVFVIIKNCLTTLRGGVHFK